MVVIALDASVSRLSIDLANRSPCAYTAPSSSSTGQQQQHRLCCSSSSLNACSASGSFVYPYLSSFSSCSSSLSSATSASKRSRNRCASESTRSRRTITDLGAARKTSSRSLVSVSHGELWAGSDASQSRLAIGARPAALLNGSSNAGSVHAAIAETAGDGLKWWERGGAPNILDVHTTEQFVHALSAAGDKLVIVEFYATWCGSCRALYPKFCKIAAEYSDVNFLKVNFDENKSMCKSLNVKVLPFFHIYRGAEGRLDSFSCSLSKLQRLKDAIAKHHDGLSDSPPEVVDDVFSTLLQKPSADISATAGGSSD